MKLECGPILLLCGARRQRFARLAAGAFVLGCPAQIHAQAAPPPVTPPTREEVTRETRIQPSPPSRLEVEGGIERAPCALDSPEFRSIHFVFRGAEFDGLEGLTRADLASSYAQVMGRDVPLSSLCEIRDRAATILRDAGYVAAVQVPEQHIVGGIIHFQVLMAHLVQVRVRGEARGAEAVLAAYFKQLTRRPLFNRFEAERYLLLASDLPGYTVRLTLRPAGTVPGDVVGDVTVQRLPAYADFIVQNGGSHELGPWGGLLRGQLFGLTGLGDRTTFSLFSTADFHEQQTIQIAHDMRLGSEGLSLSGSFTYAWARPSIPEAHVFAKTMLSTLEVDYPFIRRQQASLRGSAGMDIVDQNVWLNNAALTRDRLRVAFARIGLDAIPRHIAPSYSPAEPQWHVTALFELRQGLHALGATGNCGPSGIDCLSPGDVPPSRLEGRSNATLIRFTGYAEVRPMPKLTLALGARAQRAWQPLLSFEDFSAGNYTVGRGYDPGALLGDMGFGTQAELRYGSRIPTSITRPAIEAYGFWDHAEVSHFDSPILLTEREHLNSVGAGARVNWNRLALDASIAVPLTHIGPFNRKPPIRFLISLTTRLWPWKY